MNTFAVVMQSSAMSSAQQWMVIGLSVLSLLCALVLSHAEQIPAWKVRVMGGLAVALALAVLAQTASATVLMECSWWGCLLDTIFW